MKAEARERAWGDIDEEVLRSSLRELDRRLKAKFGERYLKLILFGSRARGDHQPDSDADVAIVMRDPIEDWWPLTQSVGEETYEILLDTGLYSNLTSSRAPRSMHLRDRKILRSFERF